MTTNTMTPELKAALEILNQMNQSIKEQQAERAGKQAFTYAVGRPWTPSDPNSSIAFYAYGGDIFHGTLTEADKYRDYCERVNAQEGNPYRVYKITELTDEDRQQLK